MLLAIAGTVPIVNLLNFKEINFLLCAQAIFLSWYGDSRDHQFDEFPVFHMD